MLKWWIGCSGFHYKHWKDVFYPAGLAQTKWFAYYCEHFKTLELNVSFYRFPRLPALEGWYNNSPKNFMFSVKVWKGITHYKQFHNTEKFMSDFYSVVEEGLKEKLGCVLFQLPPRVAYTEERLDRIMDSLDPAFNNVLEFRHSTWWNEGVYKKLAKNKISFCGMSHPDLPEDIIQNTRILYYRLHGVPELYKSPYTVKQLEKIADEIEASGKTKTAYIYFNNDIGGSAIKNAKEMMAYCLPEKVTGR
jgi:uncharacterized protein YecE (DUF72 family)